MHPGGRRCIHEYQVTSTWSQSHGNIQAFKGCHGIKSESRKLYVVPDVARAPDLQDFMQAMNHFQVRFLKKKKMETEHQKLVYMSVGHINGSKIPQVLWGL